MEQLPFNPFLADMPPRARGSVEKLENIPWQTRAAAPTEFENRLADALEKVFAQGIDALPRVIEALNQAGSRDREGRPWTEASFQAEVRVLGA